MALPVSEDVLADILRRLSPRSLASSRCVCKAWRGIVDDRRLLLPGLLPHSLSVRGIFVMCHDLRYPAFLSRPGFSLPDDFFFPGPGPNGRRSFTKILDHCNGLLLYTDPRGLLVDNPATRRRALLPPPSPHRSTSLFHSVAHLVFDPTESPHYQVLLVPDSPYSEERCGVKPSNSSQHQWEWPPATWLLCIFSSRTGKWEDRAFAREGEAATPDDSSSINRGYSAYWRGAFYVQCLSGSTVMRISLSNNKYRVIKVPTDILVNDVYLGRSEKGVCCASFVDWFKLHIWILDESCDHIEWVLKHHIDIEHSVSHVPICGRRVEGPWILQDPNNGEDFCGQRLWDVSDDDDNNNDALMTRKFEWDSDNDNILDNECEVEQQSIQANYVTFLGFHPYKDVVFLNVQLSKAVAYHLNTSKVQVLGNACPEYYQDLVGFAAHIPSSFVYTPCLMTEFPENKLEAHVKN